MIGLIGTRWKCGNTCSRGVLIRRSSCKECFMRLSHLVWVKVNRICNAEKATDSVWILCVGELAEGVHPFSFRTRQLSLLAPMVLSFRRESRSSPTHSIYANDLWLFLYTRRIFITNFPSERPFELLVHIWHTFDVVLFIRADGS